MQVNGVMVFFAADPRGTGTGDTPENRGKMPVACRVLMTAPPTPGVDLKIVSRYSGSAGHGQVTKSTRRTWQQ